MRGLAPHSNCGRSLEPLAFVRMGDFGQVFCPQSARLTGRACRVGLVPTRVAKLWTGVAAVGRHGQAALLEGCG
jgi:hypothetical protein